MFEIHQGSNLAMVTCGHQYSQIKSTLAFPLKHLVLKLTSMSLLYLKNNLYLQACNKFFGLGTVYKGKELRVRQIFFKHMYGNILIALARVCVCELTRSSACVSIFCPKLHLSERFFPGLLNFFLISLANVNEGPLR